MDIFNKTVAFVDDAFGGKQKPHFERTVFWIEQFIPECTTAHKVAAYSHDIERAMKDESKKAPEDYLDLNFLRHHQETGAKIMSDFLSKEGQAEEFIELVTHLISRHEEGGDNEQNALMDADSVSFMETNAEMFVIKKAPVEGYERVKPKLDWMFDRISSDEAKSIARANYEKWSNKLEEFKAQQES